MQNKHLEHPEDLVLLGKQSVKQVINFYREDVTATVKWDGAPAIVFGNNHENGRFFVGTKSVFNKRKVKINYTHHDIEVNHGENQKVASILHVCLDNLPRNRGIWQGDFIGFGGSDSYHPNTLTYTFPRTIERNLVFAVHTYYHGNSMKELTVSDNRYEHGTPKPIVEFVDTRAEVVSRHKRINVLLKIADVLRHFVKYPTGDDAKELKVAINKCIRENRKVDCLPGNLQRLFDIMTEVKRLTMNGIVAKSDVVCSFEGEECEHEGYVLKNDHGMFKLVNRQVFSYRNFTAAKQWQTNTATVTVKTQQGENAPTIKFQPAPQF